MIGIFDSGVGGLSIYSELKKLSRAAIIYYADSGHFPYGDKTDDQIYELSKNASEMLIENGVDIIVIGCNSATVSVISRLRSDFPRTTFVGIEPAIKPATLRGENIGLLATSATVKNHDSDALSDKKPVVRCAASGLIDKIENDLNAITDEDIYEYLESLKECDTIVLGCTHYYFIKERLQNLFPAKSFIEPADVVAKRALSLDNTKNTVTNDVFLVTGDINKFDKFLRENLGIQNAYIRKI